MSTMISTLALTLIIPSVSSIAHDMFHGFHGINISQIPTDHHSRSLHDSQHDSWYEKRFHKWFHMSFQVKHQAPNKYYGNWQFALSWQFPLDYVLWSKFSAPCSDIEIPAILLRSSLRIFSMQSVRQLTILSQASSVCARSRIPSYDTSIVSNLLSSLLVLGKHMRSFS